MATLSVYLNDTVVATRTDNNPLPAGLHVWLRNASTQANVNHSRLDDFQVRRAL